MPLYKCAELFQIPVLILFYHLVNITDASTGFGMLGVAFAGSGFSVLFDLLHDDGMPCSLYLCDDICLCVTETVAN